MHTNCSNNSGPWQFLEKLILANAKPLLLVAQRATVWFDAFGNHVTQMHNPPHPGEFIEGVYLEPCGLSIRQAAERLDVSASTLQRLIAGKSRVSPDMALRLSRVLGRSAESWLTLQVSHDLWQARQRLDLSALSPMELKAV